MQDGRSSGAAAAARSSGPGAALRAQARHSLWRAPTARGDLVKGCSRGGLSVEKRKLSTTGYGLGFVSQKVAVAAQQAAGREARQGAVHQSIGTISSIHAHALMQPPLRRTLRERRRRQTTVSSRRRLQTHAKSLRAKESMERQEPVYTTDIATDLLSQPLQVCRPCFSASNIECGPPDEFAL